MITSCRVGRGCIVLLFTILGEYVVSSEWDNVQNRDSWLYIILIINFMCLGEARWGRSPPRVKDPNVILGQTYGSSDESSKKCWKTLGSLR